MKTIEQQLDDMLPEDIKRQRPLAAARTEYFENVAFGLREIGRAGLTVAQATKNMNAALAAADKKNIM